MVGRPSAAGQRPNSGLGRVVKWFWAGPEALRGRSANRREANPVIFAHRAPPFECCALRQGMGATMINGRPAERWHLGIECCASLEHAAPQEYKGKTSNGCNGGSGVGGQALLRRQMIGAATLAIGGLGAAPVVGLAQTGDSISRSDESIRQERWFQADRQRVYESLTISRLFDRVTQRSEAMQSPDMAKLRQLTQIDPRVGGSFTIFGGYIVGRQLELEPAQLIVQAWRVGSWGRGAYSVVRFELLEHEAGTKIVLN